MGLIEIVMTCYGGKSKFADVTLPPPPTLQGSQTWYTELIPGISVWKLGPMDRKKTETGPDYDWLGPDRRSQFSNFLENPWEKPAEIGYLDLYPGVPCL